MGKNVLDGGLGNNFLDMTSKAQATKAKINKWHYICRGTTSNKKLLHSQRNNQQNEEATYRTGENICKPYIK